MCQRKQLTGDETTSQLAENIETFLKAILLKLGLLVKDKLFLAYKIC